MSRMKAKKRRIMTKMNRKKRHRQAGGKQKELDLLHVLKRAKSLEAPTVFGKQERDVSNY